MPDPNDLLPAALVEPVEGVPYPDELLDLVAADPADNLDRPEWVELATLEAVEWTMARRAFVDRDIAEAKQQRDAWVARIDSWYAHVTAGLVRRRAFLDDRLTAYALTERATTGDRVKTVNVPSGVIKTRGSSAPVVVLGEWDEAEAEVIAWAADSLTGDEYDLVVKTTSSLRISELRKIVGVEQLDGGPAPAVDVVVCRGERVPGVVVVRPEVTASVVTDSGPRALGSGSIDV